MRRSNNRRRPLHLEMGVYLLISEVFSIGLNVIPPVTLLTVVGQTLLYMDIIEVPWRKEDVCINAKKVWYDKDYRSLIFSTFEHADDMHLYYNMVSFLLKGRSLESKYGSANFCLLLSLICLLTSSIYVFLALFFANILQMKYLLHSCAIGFSGVIFALKILTTEYSIGYSNIMGFNVPTKHVAWVELIAIHMLVPNASFLGHLAGIIAGTIYVRTPLRRIIDSSITKITGMPIYRSYGWRNYSRNQYW